MDAPPTHIGTKPALPGDRSITSHVRSALLALLLAASLGHSGGKTFQELYSFTGAPDRLSPEGALIQASDGNFYGTTKYGPGPLTEDWSGYGTVFRITPEGTLTTLIAFNGTFAPITLSPLP